MQVRAGVDLDGVVARLLDTLVETTGVGRAGLALSEGAGRRLRFTANDHEVALAPGRVPELSWCHIDAFDDVPLTAVVRTGEEVVGSMDDLADRFPDFVRGQRAAGVHAVATLPLVSGGSAWGGVIVFFDGPQVLGAHHLTLLRAIAARAVTEIGAARHALPADPRVLDDCGCDGIDAVCVEVEPRPVSVAVARRFARRRFQDWGIDADVIDTAVLCLSELVTNVVMHASSPARIAVRREQGRVSLTVTDSGGSGSAAPTEAGSDRLLVHGRGLQLVQALADDWGSTSDASGTTVWCAFTAPGGGI